MNLWKNHVLVALVAVVILFAGVSIFKQVTYLPIAQYLPPASTQLAQVSAPTSGLIAHQNFGSGGRAFNGTSDYVDMGDSYASFIDGDTKTLAAWVSAGSGSMDARAVAINSTNSRLGLSISAKSTWTAEYRRTGDAPATLNSGSSLSPGTWTHVAVVVNGTTIQIYINGSLAGSASDVELSPALSGSNKNGTIGAWNNNGTRTSFFAGSINDVRLYNRALDSGEISNLYAAGQGSQGGVSNPPPPPPADSGSGGVQNPPANPPPASGTGITPTVGNITYYISNSGSDTNPGTQSQPLQTINKCAEVSRAGNTCLILPGRYNEMVETKNAGSSGSLITFKAQGGVIVHQFSIKHPYTRVEGLEITAQGFPLKLDSGFGSAIELTSASHHCEIINNYVHDLFLGISGIKVNGSNHSIKFNRVSRPGLNSMIDLLGTNILVENNTFEDNAGFDVFRLFGTNNTFRRNWVNNIHGNLPPGAPAGNHPDFIQSFGNNGTASHSHLIEQNFISNLESQIGQISPFDADIRDWTFRYNVFYNTKLGFSQSLPGLVIENNTMYRVNREGGGFTGLNDNLPRGQGVRGVFRNNIYLALGDGSNNRGGWYSVDPAMLPTAYVDYNYVAGFAPTYDAKRTDGCGGVDTPYRFCEAHGVNGGNPMMVNETNPLGPDGKPYQIGADPGTVNDDGLRLLANSPLCTKGQNGTYMGAYSCNGAPTGLPPVIPPVVPAVDTILPTVAITSPVTGTTVAGTVTVAATASDNVAVLGVQFKLGANNLGVEDTTSPYSVSWNTSALQPGTYTLTAVARDAAQSKTSTAVTVTISSEGTIPTQPPESDTILPTISITAPAAGATVSGLVNLTATASDNKGVTGVQFKVDGVNLGSELTTAPYSGSWNTQGVSSGNHILTAVARDAAGNSKTSGPVIIVVSAIQENRAPSASAGNDQTITLPATLTLQGSGLDLDQDALTYSWSKVSGPTATFSANTANTTVTFSSEGTYVFRLTVSDGVLTGSDTVTITVHAPVDPTKDTDGDGIYDGSDKCPLTPVALKSRVNSLGCPLPKMDSFTKKTDLSNVDLRSVQYLELSNSDGKIVFSTPLVLIRGSATESLDIDSHLTISNRTVSLNSASLSELNKPATITLYRISHKNPRITKDSVPCSQCSILSYTGGNIVFTVPSFSAYVVEETPEDARNEKGQFTPTVPQLPPAPVTPPPSQPSFFQRFVPSFLSPNRQSTSPSTVTQPPKATGPFVPLSDVSPEDGSTRSSDQSIIETVYVVIKYIYERILNGWERLWGN